MVFGSVFRLLNLGFLCMALPLALTPAFLLPIRLKLSDKWVEGVMLPMCHSLCHKRSVESIYMRLLSQKGTPGGCNHDLHPSRPVMSSDDIQRMIIGRSFGPDK